MKYPDWKKLLSGGFWQRDPPSMKFVGLERTKTPAEMSGNPTMPPIRLSKDKGFFGVAQPTSIMMVVAP
jgi:hypothetical protein